MIQLYKNLYIHYPHKFRSLVCSCIHKQSADKTAKNRQNKASEMMVATKKNVWHGTLEYNIGTDINRF